MWLQKEKTKSDEYKTHLFHRQIMEAQEMVASKDVHLVILQKKIQSAKTQEERERFEKEQSELIQVT